MRLVVIDSVIHRVAHRHKAAIEEDGLLGLALSHGSGMAIEAALTAEHLEPLGRLTICLDVEDGREGLAAGAIHTLPVRLGSEGFMNASIRRVFANQSTFYCEGYSGCCTEIATRGSKQPLNLSPSTFCWEVSRAGNVNAGADE